MCGICRASVLGTRRPTLYGTQMAERLGRELAARGLVLVSGMARQCHATGQFRAQPIDQTGRQVDYQWR